MILNTLPQKNVEISSGAYAWMILPHALNDDTTPFTLTECLAALYVKGAQAEQYFLERDVQQYRCIILHERIADSDFMAVFVPLVKHLNTIAYGFIEIKQNIAFDDFIASLMGQESDVDTTRFRLTQRILDSKLANPQSNYARYLRDQMGKHVLAHLQV